MASKIEQMTELQKKNLEAATRLAQMSVENSQRIMELQVQTAKALFEEGVENAKAMASTQDPQKMLQLRTQYAQVTTERMLACAREIAEVAAHSQSEFSKMISQQLSGGGQDMVEAFNKMFAGMPAADPNAVNSIQNAMDTARKAFEEMTRASTDAFQAFSQNSVAAPKKSTSRRR